MTNDEWERLKESLRARRSPTNDIDQTKAAADMKLAEERRRLDRDMDRIERALTKLVKAPREKKRQIEQGHRGNQFKESFEKQHAEIRKFAARSDAKIKALVEEMQRRNTRQS
jgi:hypothetical protein